MIGFHLEKSKGSTLENLPVHHALVFTICTRR